MNREIRIERMTAADAAEAAALEAACFGDAWTEESVRSTIEGRASLCLSCRIGGEFAGCCFTQVVLDEGEILRIGVYERFRRCGIGSRLMQALRDMTPQVNIWYLDVRKSNLPAQGLYRSYGFAEIGLRKKYYHQPEEDAVLMQWSRSES